MDIDFNLKDRTELFYKWLIVPEEVIKAKPEVNYNINNIMFKNLIIFSEMGSGKTETVRSIVERIVEEYGEDKVNAISSPNGDLELLMNSLDDRLVQVLFCDNLTLKRIDKDVLHEYFKIRHYWKDQVKRDYGYIISILACHRFHGITTELRTNVDCILVRNSSLNPYDQIIIRKFIGDDGVVDLQIIEAYKDRIPELKKYSIFTTKFMKGILYTPMAKKNYLKVVEEEPSTYYYRLFLGKYGRVR